MSFYETWQDKPEYKEKNNNWGMCNTGSMEPNFRVCVLGGIFCNVDHVAIKLESEGNFKYQAPVAQR